MKEVVYYFSLECLKILDKFNGFTFTDLSRIRQQRLLRKTLRTVELSEKTIKKFNRNIKI